MKTPLQITFRDFECSPAIEAKIQEKVAALEKHVPEMTSLRVVAERPHRRHQHGNHYCIKIEVEVPGKTVVFANDSTLANQYSEFHVALHDTFDGIRRALESHRQARRERVKRNMTAEADFDRIQNIR